jgi:hypothetical protein
LEVLKYIAKGWENDYKKGRKRNSR